MINFLDVSRTISDLINTKARKVTTFISKDITIVATQPYYKGKPPSKKDRGNTLVVTYGKPNYESRLALRKIKTFPQQIYKFSNGN